MKPFRWLKNYSSILRNASEQEKKELRAYEVSIDRVEAHRNQSLRNMVAGTEKTVPYRYQDEQIDWNVMRKIGLTKELLKEMNTLDHLLRGFKTPTLIPVKMDLGTGITTIQVRLSLKETYTGGVVEAAKIHFKMDYGTKSRC